jgi:hypothetical protein
MQPSMDICTCRLFFLPIFCYLPSSIGLTDSPAYYEPSNPAKFEKSFNVLFAIVTAREAPSPPVNQVFNPKNGKRPMYYRVLETAPIMSVGICSPLHVVRVLLTWYLACVFQLMTCGLTRYFL